MSLKSHFEHFDALRFFAFLGVFISHIAVFLGFTHAGFDTFKPTWLTHGDLGVSFFFVLSGFLITYLLLKEKVTGNISLPHFYTRRILRIWPVYFLVFIIGFVIIPLIAPATFPFLATNNGTSPWWFILFLANIKLAFSYAPPAILGVLWSISVEEQFYLVWPIIMKKVRRVSIFPLLVGIIIASCVYRFTESGNYGAVHYFTFSVFSDMAIGCLTAYAVFENSRLVTWITNTPRLVIAFNYILLATLIPLRTLTSNAFAVAVFPVIFALLFAFILLEQTYAKHSLFKVGNFRLATKLGKISYGLYAYHMIAFFIVLMTTHTIFDVPYKNTSIGLFILHVILSFMVTIILASLSYKYLELPFLKLKQRFGYTKKELPEANSFSN